MRRFDLVVLDFDGTVCDSAGVKTEAFHALYRNEQGEEFADAFRDYHIAHAGVSRFDKIKHAEEVMLGRACSDERLAAVAERFGELVEDAVVAAPLIEGMEAFIEACSGRLPVTVASATPTDELRRIVHRRSMDDWFAAVDGSPAPKGDIVAAHVRRFGVDPANTVMIGDQFSDQRAAQQAGTHFLAVRTDPDVSFDADVDAVDDLFGAMEFIGR